MRRQIRTPPSFREWLLAHKRYNTIDKLKVGDEEVLQMPMIKRTMVDFYKKLYAETETWRPSFEF